MSIVSKLKFQYNTKLRPKLDSDVKMLIKKFENKFPFDAMSDEEHLEMSLAWLTHTNKELGGKGFPTKFNLMHDYGLGPSYPETTGYTINTLLTILRNEPSKNVNYEKVCDLVQNSAKFLLDECQLEGGSFTGGHKKLSNFLKPSVFNTGQILLGLTDLYETLNSVDFQYTGYFDIDLDRLKESITRAGKFLAGEVEESGAYNLRYSFAKIPSPYYAKSSSGLLRGGIVLNDKEIIKKAKKNFDWVVTQQEDSGWINHWGLDGDWAVLHRTAYTLRGMIEAYLYFKDEKYLNCVLKGIAFLNDFDRTNFSHPKLVPSYAHKSGDFRNEICLTGLSQLAIVLAKLPNKHRAHDHNKLYNNILSQTKQFQCRGFNNPNINGGMPASYPLNGTYQAYDLIEWGVKFFLDTVLLGMGVRADEIKG